jgi:Ca2+-binding RTX toxin-like protein
MRRLLIAAAVLLVSAAALSAVPAGATVSPTCFGLSASRHMLGTSGADVLNGTAGDDVIIGLGGNDAINGRGGNDRICGGAGNDALAEGSGNDRSNGGTGRDTLSFTGAASSVTADLGHGTATGYGTDKIESVENLVGSNAADTLVGNGAANILSGGLGNDTLRGGGGNDILHGGPGSDGASYVDALAGVRVTLTGRSASCNGAVACGIGADVLDGIENARGSSFNDALIGDANANALAGDRGNDVIDSAGGDDTVQGNGGADELTGGEGSDSVSYADAQAGVGVSLTSGEGYCAVAGCGIGGDVLDGFEGVYGSPYGDAITGDDGANSIFGLGGADDISAMAGDDIVVGGSGDDSMDGGDNQVDTTQGMVDDGSLDVALFADSPVGVTANLATGVATGDGSDDLSNFEGLAGTLHADHLTGDGATNLLVGLAGDDAYAGGSGVDFVGFLTTSNPNLGVSANLALGQASGEGDDSITGIEGLLGTDLPDELTGDGDGNILIGFDGPDTLNGGGGGDILDGRSGDDSLFGDDGNDTIVPGPGSDGIDGGAGYADVALFTNASAGVTVDLAAGSSSGEGSDEISAIESVTGSSFADWISGNDLANLLSGGAGNDTILGLAGTDVVDGGAGTDTLNGGNDADVCYNGETVSSCESTVDPGSSPALPSLGQDTTAAVDQVRSVLDPSRVRRSAASPERPPRESGKPGPSSPSARVSASTGQIGSLTWATGTQCDPDVGGTINYPLPMHVTTTAGRQETEVAWHIAQLYRWLPASQTWNLEQNSLWYFTNPGWASATGYGSLTTSFGTQYWQEYPSGQVPGIDPQVRFSPPYVNAYYGVWITTWWYTLGGAFLGQSSQWFPVGYLTFSGLSSLATYNQWCYWA